MFDGFKIKRIHKRKQRIFAIKRRLAVILRDVNPSSDIASDIRITLGMCNRILYEDEMSLKSMGVT